MDSALFGSRGITSAEDAQIHRTLKVPPPFCYQTNRAYIEQFTWPVDCRTTSPRRGAVFFIQFRIGYIPPLKGCVNQLYISCFICACGGIHPGRVEPAIPIELITSWKEAPQARRSCATSFENFTQSFLHHAQPKTHGSGRDYRSSLNVIDHIFS